MAKIIIIYSTTDGHTVEICKYLRTVIEKHNHQVVLISIDNEAEVDLASFDKIVIGASIRYGKHKPEVYGFIKKHIRILTNKPGAFFSVSVVARKPDKNRPETNPYLLKFLKKSSWKPTRLAVFAGKIDYQKYTFMDRLIIRLIMWITKGPTDPHTKIVYTNWQDVDDFAGVICEMQ